MTRRFRAGEPDVLRQPKMKSTSLALTPRHQRLAGKATVGPQNDPNLRPACADLRYDPGGLLHRAGSSGV
jgi:hypothetical protein